jgi:ABC-type multidrug transport system fused ATPase/permease subunit
MIFFLLNLPPIGIGLTFFFYGLNNRLSPSLVFTCLALVNLLRVPFIVLPIAINNMFNYKASLERVLDFLRKPELPKREDDEEQQELNKADAAKKRGKKSAKQDDWVMKIEHGTFKWSEEEASPVLKDVCSSFAAVSRMIVRSRH